ncbi:MAG: DsbA family oxidoreductase [Aquihabitans sp.]
MKIEIWSDVICPFCGLGAKRLEHALEQFEHRDQVQVVHRSFELDATYPVGETALVREKLKVKYGLTAEQVAANSARIEADAAAEGLQPYHVHDNRFGNTALAHQLLIHAAAEGLGDQAWAQTYEAYFGGMRDIFTIDALVDLGVEIGLKADDVREVLTDGRYAATVKADTAEAQQLGASGVPFIVIDRRYGIAGAQSTATMLDTIRTAWQEQQPAIVTVGDQGADSCGPEGCAV